MLLFELKKILDKDNNNFGEISDFEYLFVLVGIHEVVDAMGLEL